MTPAALSSIRVLEVGSLIAGPFAGRLMADFGADVIKVEAPDGPDPLREWGNGAYRGRKLGGLCRSDATTARRCGSRAVLGVSKLTQNA